MAQHASLTAYTLNPVAGTWTLIVEFAEPVIGDEISQPFSGNIQLDNVECQGAWRAEQRPYETGGGRAGDHTGDDQEQWRGARAVFHRRAAQLHGQRASGITVPAGFEQRLYAAARDRH